MLDPMLAKRIAGILRQYPNPEVAFYATSVLIGISPVNMDLYMASCARKETYGRRGSKFYTYYRGHDGRTYSQKVAADTPLDLEHCVTNYGHPPGRRQLASDLEEMGLSLAAFMQMSLADGRWFDGTDLTETVPTEGLATWVGAWVNRWIKGFAAIRTAADEQAHYAGIRQLTANIIELADYVSQNRVDPGRLTLNQLVYRSRRWHAALNKALKAQDRREMAKLTPPSNRVFDDGPYGVFQLDADEALYHEGKIMQHCVAGYTTRVRGGDCTIYSVRDAANLSHATLEVRGDAVWQIKGIKNAEIKDPDLCQVIANFIAHAGFANRTSSCQLEPAPIEIEPGGEDEVPAGLGQWRRARPPRFW